VNQTNRQSGQRDQVFPTIFEQRQNIDGNDSDLSSTFRELLLDLRARNIFHCRNHSRLNNIVGIVGVCPHAYQETFTRRRIQDCWVTSGDLSYDREEKKLLHIADVDV